MVWPLKMCVFPKRVGFKKSFYCLIIMLSIVDGGEKLFLANFTLSLSAKSLTGEMVISQNKNSLPNNILLMQVIYKCWKTNFQSCTIILKINFLYCKCRSSRFQAQKGFVPSTPLPGCSSRIGPRPIVYIV